MTELGSTLVRAALAMALCVLFVAGVAHGSYAQTSPVERAFPESKSAVEKALKQLQPAMSGHLPALEGFAETGDHPLSRYQRAFFQCEVQVSTTPSGGSVVKVSAKVTAWYADPRSSQSGYQLLKSNGRIESDVLDQLADQLAGSSLSSQSLSGESANSDQATSAASTATKPNVAEEPVLSAPMPRPQGSGTFSPLSGEHSMMARSAADQPAAGGPSQKEPNDVHGEISSLEEVLKNQAHPKNLVAVKKSGTPVVASPSLSGKTLFMASVHDEFEMLDYNADWVHVRISGLSRGWIWRTSLEMPEGIPDVPQAVTTAKPAAADLFQVSREETAPFPGDWGPLRGKSVKIISVQKIRENEQDAGAPAKLEFAKALLDRSYEELAKSQELSGLVLIFDSVDGGMIAATLPTIQRWKAGALNDAALWHQCYFDPPETFTASNAAGSR